MHWFDRATKQLAEAPNASTRRTALKGAAFAAFAAPFGSTAVTYAANQMRRLDSEADCLECLRHAGATYNRSVLACNVLEGKYRPLLKPKGGKGKAPGGGGKKKKKKGVKPAEAVKEFTCLGYAYDKWLHNGQGCRIASCSGEGGEGPRLPEQGLESEKCPAGTGYCAAGLCCYSGDKCCKCENGGGGTGGYICCASVVGCECCGPITGV